MSSLQVPFASSIYYLFFLVLDPTKKLKFFTSYGRGYYIEEQVADFRQRFLSAFNLYYDSDDLHNSDQIQEQHQQGPKLKRSDSKSHLEEALSALYVIESDDDDNFVQMRSEAEQYLEEPRHNHNTGGVFNPLQYWRVRFILFLSLYLLIIFINFSSQTRCAQWPRLSRMARDYLATQGSSTASERLFSASGRMVTASRNRLTARIVTATQSLQAWYPGIRGVFGSNQQTWSPVVKK